MMVQVCGPIIRPQVPAQGNRSVTADRRAMAGRVDRAPDWLTPAAACPAGDGLPQQVTAASTAA